MLTRADILAGIAHLEDEVKSWEASRDESLKVGYQGRDTKMLSSDVESAAIALFELCDRTDIDPEAWSLVRAIDALDDRFSEFGEAARTSGARVNPGGTVELWGAYSEVLRARTPRRWSRPTPLKQMVAQRINPDQIAKEYHWLAEHGRDRALEMIQEELEQPGTHYQAELWVHPKELQYKAELQAWWDERTQRIEGAARELKAKHARNAKPKQEAPESLDFLIQSKVHVDQILKMKPSVTHAEVQERAVELGIALDDETVGHVSYRQAQAAKELREARSRQAQLEVELKQKLNERPGAEQNTYPEFGDDLEGRIVRMSEDGLRPGKIAESLRHLPNPPTPVQCGRIIAKYKSAAAEAAMPSMQLQ